MIEQTASPVVPSSATSPDALGAGLHAILDAIPDGITVQDHAGRLVYANAAAAVLCGFPSAREFLEAPASEILARFELLDEDGRTLSPSALPGRLALAGASPPPLTVQFVVRATGDRRWSIVRSTPLRDADGRITHAVNAFQDVTPRILAEHTLRASEERYRLAAEAAAELDESLDLDATIEVTARIAVPRLADWCVIDLLEPDGTVRRASVRAGDPGFATIADQLRAYPSAPGSVGLMGRSMVDGIARCYRLDDVDLRAITVDERHAELLRALEPNSAIVVPLVGRGAILGAMALVRGWSGRRFSDDDLPIAEELGRRAALAIGNAALFRAEAAARRAAEEAAGRTGLLQRLTGALAETRTRAEVARTLLEHARGALGATGGAVYEPDPASGDLVAVAIEGYPDRHRDRWQRIPRGPASMLVEVLDSGDDAWREDLAAVAATRPEVAAAVELTGDHAAACLALASRGTVLGVMALTWREARQFTREQRDLTRTIADLGGQALERAVLAEARTALVGDLEDQRARLTAVLEQMPGGVIIAEAPSGRLLLGNRQVDRIWRHPFIAAASIGEYGRYEGFAPDGSPLRPEAWPLARAIGGEVVENEEIDFRRGDGTMGTMLVSAAPIHDPAGAIVAGVATFTDITDRRRAQERERYLAEAGQLLGASLDAEETLARIAALAVPRIADWCAVDLAAEGSVPHRLAVAHVDPAKVELARRLRERHPPDPDAATGVAAVIRDGKPELVPVVPPEMIDAAALDDEDRDMLRALDLRSYMSVPLMAAGRVLGAITFVGSESGRQFDESDLRFAEALAARAAAALENARLYRERVDAQGRLEQVAASEHARAAELDAVIAAMAEAIVVCDDGGRVLLANPAARAMAGPAGPEGWDDLLALVTITGDPPQLGERFGPVELPTRDEDDRWLELATYPVARAGDPSGSRSAETIVVLRDISEARRRQAVRETFVGVLSHELRTPVTTIYGGAKLLARDGLSEDRRRSVFEDIAVEAERLHRLVEDVIALNRFGEADGDVGREPVLLQRLLPSVVRAEEARWPGVRFVLALPPALPTVEADRTYVEQVIRNLLSNAAKYGGPGTTVEVHADADADEVRVRIVDDGPGFPAEEADRLFDLFFRSATTASAAAGAGIGLFVCARLIRAMGGRIWARPLDGRGSEFGFALGVMRED